ncbi:MAG TPA: putative Fe-S cluster assembly protein SufT [Burkholderiaceae bacterium]|nr:putative Fe-S cluster assembly protein SufT [Burkholderiaceae bacterium]
MGGGRHGEITEVILERDCPAVAVPWGTPVTLQAGRTGYISQRLGGTFTVMVDGNLYRIDGRHADALGLDDDALTPANDGHDGGHDSGLDEGPVTAESVEAAAWQRMASCYDPEIPVDIVDLGLVYGCEVAPAADGRFRIAVRMTLTAPGCGMGTLLADEVKQKLEGIRGVERVDVDLVWDPPWSREMMSEAARLEMGLM